jgi:hypothetical protein
VNVLLWILQVLLALHTAIGAVWKFSHPEATVASLEAIPHGVWLGLGVGELLWALGLVLPAFRKTLASLVPIAAACIALEMLAFTVVSLASGAAERSQVIYWLVVAAVCAFVAWGRARSRPLGLHASGRHSERT